MINLKATLGFKLSNLRTMPDLYSARKRGLTPRLHGTGFAWSRYQIEFFQDERSFTIYDITKFNNN